MSPDWPAYYEAIGEAGARTPLLKALERFEAEAPEKGRFAVDLGCGSGSHTVELLRRGWRVLAIDAQVQAFERLLRRVQPEMRSRLETVLSRIEEAEWPTADLVNASLSLPFLAPSAFSTTWQRIRESLGASRGTSLAIVMSGPRWRTGLTSAASKWSNYSKRCASSTSKNASGTAPPPPAPPSTGICSKSSPEERTSTCPWWRGALDPPPGG